MNRTTYYTELAFILIIVFLSSLTAYQRNSIWKDDLSLWTDNVKKSPMKARVYQYLGLAYHKYNDFDSAILQYKKSLSIDPLQPDVYNNLGVSYFYKGEVDLAISHFKHAISIDPLHADAHYNLGVAYGEKGLFDLAKKEIRKGIQLPRH